MERKVWDKWNPPVATGLTQDDGLGFDMANDLLPVMGTWHARIALTSAVYVNRTEIKS